MEMKKLLAAALCLLLAVCLAMPACAAQSTDTDYAPLSLPEAVRGSNLIVRAAYTGRAEGSSHTDHLFAVDQVLYGRYEGETLNLCEYADIPPQYTYDPGQEYLLVLKRTVSVYYEHDRLLPAGGLFVPLGGEGQPVMWQDFPGTEGEALAALAQDPEGRLAEILGANPKLKEYDGYAFVDSDDTGAITAGASHVMKVKVNGSLANSENSGAAMYSCDIEKLYNGKPAGSVANIRFFDGTVEPGREYIVLANSMGQGSQGYTLAAKANCVFAPGAAELSQVEEQLNKASFAFPAEPSALPFADVGHTDWFYVPVAQLYSAGLLNGTAPDTFGSGSTIRREDVVVILGRLAEKLGVEMPALDCPSGFADALPDTYYMRYLVWAQENGLVNGTGPWEFGVGKPVTRQDFCTILDRFAAYLYRPMKDLDGSGWFTDGSSIAGYAQDAVRACVNGKVVNGYRDGTFKPAAPIKRSEAAKVLAAFIEQHLAAITIE